MQIRDCKLEPNIVCHGTQAKDVVKRDTFTGGRVTPLHFTVLLRFSQILSKDPSKQAHVKLVSSNRSNRNGHFWLVLLFTGHTRSQWLNFSASDSGSARSIL